MAAPLRKGRRRSSNLGATGRACPRLDRGSPGSGYTSAGRVRIASFGFATNQPLREFFCLLQVLPRFAVVAKSLKHGAAIAHEVCE